MRGEAEDVIWDGTHEAVLGKVEVIEVVAVVEGGGERAWDVIVGKIEVG